jgi:hypothetical protein
MTIERVSTLSRGGTSGPTGTENDVWGHTTHVSPVSIIAFKYLYSRLG